MTVFPMIDRTSGEVILIYRNKRKGEKTGWLDAEVYKFHDEGLRVATHFGAYDLNKEYLATLKLPGKDDEIAADAAVRFYDQHCKRTDGDSVQRASSRLPEYLAARRKFPLDKTPSEG